MKAGLSDEDYVHEVEDELMCVLTLSFAVASLSSLSSGCSTCSEASCSVFNATQFFSEQSLTL